MSPVLLSYFVSNGQSEVRGSCWAASYVESYKTLGKTVSPHVGTARATCERVSVNMNAVK